MDVGPGYANTTSAAQQAARAHASRRRGAQVQGPQLRSTQPCPQDVTAGPRSVTAGFWGRSSRPGLVCLLEAAGTAGGVLSGSSGLSSPRSTAISSSDHDFWRPCLGVEHFQDKI